MLNQSQVATDFFAHFVATCYDRAGHIEGLGQGTNHQNNLICSSMHTISALNLVREISSGQEQILVIFIVCMTASLAVALSSRFLIRTFASTENTPSTKLHSSSSINFASSDARVFLKKKLVESHPPFNAIPPKLLGLERRLSKNGRPYYRNAIPPALSTYSQLKGNGLYSYSVAGCLHHQSALDSATFGRRNLPVYFRCNALLYPEVDNIHDVNAIAVSIGGIRVGYIPRNDTEIFHSEVFKPSVDIVQCRALIENGAPNWFVKLDFVQPLMLSF